MPMLCFKTVSTYKKLLLLLCLLLVTTSTLAGTPRRNEPIQPLRQEQNLDPRKVAIGDLLFHDVRLSADNTLSCASCHNLATNGSDSLPSSVGIGGTVGPIKSPTVYNSGTNFLLFWDGRAADLVEQAAGPINNSIEMGSNWEQVLTKLRKDPTLVKTFKVSYPEGITPNSITNAIATFERSLITSDAPFDRWLNGDSTALNKLELKGYQLFKSYGCASCHQGQNVGGNMFATMGAMGDYFSDRGGEITPADLGRYNVTKNATDRHFFKVPSLRLSTRQKFFFHDASESTLEGAIKIMAKYQLGRTIQEPDVAAITAFLKSLVGTHPRLTP